MVTEIFFETSFNSAHWLPCVSEDHKCRRVHGHTYRVRIVARGPVGAEGMVVDYAELRRAWEPLHATIDHRLLNDIDGLENPTSELIAAWIIARMRESCCCVVEVAVRETESAGAVVRVEGARCCERHAGSSPSLISSATAT